MWMKRQVHVTILKVHEFLTAFKTELIEHGRRVKGKRARTGVLNRPEFKTRLCSVWAVRHRTNYCPGFTPWPPQLWDVSSSTDAVEVLGWLNNRSAHSARPSAWYGAGASALRRVSLTISQDVGRGLQSSKKWKLTKTEHSKNSVKCQVFFILKNWISSNVLPT